MSTEEHVVVADVVGASILGRTNNSTQSIRGLEC